MRLMLATAACAALAVLTAPPVLGAEVDGEHVEVTPADVRPGDEVEVRVRGCEERHGVARSEVFVAEAKLAPAVDEATGADRTDDTDRTGGTERAGGAGGGELFGEARVSSSARPGSYRVEVACDGEDARFTGRVTVAGDEGGRGDGHDSGDRGREEGGQTGGSHPQAEASEPAPLPTAPVQAGGGGTAGGGGVSVKIGPAALASLSGALVCCMMLAVRRGSRPDGR